MDRIGSDVERQLGRFAGQPPALLMAIHEAWARAVGETIAANAWPARVAGDGTLHVSTSSSTWAFELGQLAPKVLEQLRAELGEAAPPAVRFALGPLPESSPETPAEATRRVVEPTPETIAEAEALAAGIEDENLRKIVAKSAALSLARAAAGRGF